MSLTTNLGLAAGVLGLAFWVLRSRNTKAAERRATEKKKRIRAQRMLKAYKETMKGRR